MSLERKLVGEIKIKASNGAVFYDIYKNRPNDFSHFSPNIVNSVKLRSGEFGKPGAVLIWTYAIQGQETIIVSEIEEVNDEKMFVKQKVIEGVLLSQYKSFEFMGQVVPKDQETSLVEWTVAYEKMNSDVPEPSPIINALIAVVKDIDDQN